MNKKAYIFMLDSLGKIEQLPLPFDAILIMLIIEPSSFFDIFYIINSFH